MLERIQALIRHAGVAVILMLTMTSAAVGSALAKRVADPEKGVASYTYLATRPSKLAPLHLAWAYDWAWFPPPHLRGIEWVPMVWGPMIVTRPIINALRADRRTGKAHFLLGFNEPDSSTQSNMTPQQAAQLWPALESTGLPLGSPAPAQPFDGWLTRFMALAQERHLRVDFIALHFYPDYTNPNAVPDLRKTLITLYAQYRKPIWVTELGALDVRSWGGQLLKPPSAARAVGFMRQVVRMLRRLSFVKRYAWFTDNCWRDPVCHYSSMYDGSGRLTALGTLYSGL